MKNKDFNWIYHFHMQEESGMSVAMYCKENDINIKTWNYQKQKHKPKASKFIPLEVEHKTPKRGKVIEFTIDDDGHFSVSGNMAVMPEVVKFWRAIA